jgi:hypothetical protein
LIKRLAFNRDYRESEGGLCGCCPRIHAAGERPNALLAAPLK